MVISSSSIFHIFFAIAVATILLALSQTTGSVHAATFTVTKTADTNDGTCDADCSLREAIIAANAAGGADTITFDPTVFPPGAPATISPATAFDTIIEDLTIDATGAGVIIDGTGTGPNSEGIDFSAGTFSLIGGGGLTIQNFTDDGVHILASGGVTISGTTANNNGDNGFDVVAAYVAIRHSIANGNDTEGFEINTLGNIDIYDSTANNSVDGDGFELESDFGIFACGLTASGNFNDGLHMDHELVEFAKARVVHSVFENNGGDGIDFDSDSMNSSGINLFSAGANNISGNGSGLDLDDDVTVSATGSWWGDPSGPMHPSNPGGSGDDIEDSASTSSGTVVFDPFETSPSALAGTCPPMFLTPTPRPAPATSAPTPTVVEQLPDTGGTPSDGGSLGLAWLAAITGAIALMGAGSGLWLAYQRRRPLAIHTKD